MSPRHPPASAANQLSGGLAAKMPRLVIGLAQDLSGATPGDATHKLSSIAGPLPIRQLMENANTLLSSVPPTIGAL